MKTLILSKYNQLKILISLTLVTSLLLMFRIKMSESFYLLFLVWNIFLAAIPYGISFFAKLYPSFCSKTLIKPLLLIIWILFLPNAPYILSDFTHLKWTSPQFLVLDTAIITGFSALGLLYMFYSIKDVQELFFSTLSRKRTYLLLITLCLLLGFGIYLGRYLRWNSWDILQQPENLATDIGNLIIHPIRNKLAWMVTVSYAAISATTITLLNKLKWVH